MAFNMNPGRSPFLKTGNGLPSALLQTLNPISGSTVKRVKNTKGEVFDKTTTQVTVPGTPGTPTTVIKGTRGTLGTPGTPDKYKGPLTTPDKWNAFLKTQKGQEYIKKTKGEPGKPATPDVIVPGTPGTPPMTVMKESEKPVMGKIYDVSATKSFTEDNSGKSVIKGTVTTNPEVAKRYKEGTSNYNNYVGNIYKPALEGSPEAKGLTGPSLDIRNKKAEARLKNLQRTSNVNITENNIGTARKVASEQNKVKQKENDEMNKPNTSVQNAMGAAFQLRNKNKKAPTKQMKSKKKTPAKMKKY